MAAEAGTRTAPPEPEPGPGPGRSPAALLRHLRSNAARRMGWGLADQIVSSLTNFAISIYVVHSLGAAQFGAFSLAYVTFGFALNASRGLATDPLMVRFSGTDPPTWQRATARCTGTAVNTGLIIGAFVLVAAVALSGAARSAFLALGLTLPLLLLQDSWRYSFFALGRGGQAFLNDCIQAATLFPALYLLNKTGHGDVFWFVFAWGATAGIAALAGPWQARVVPRLSGVWEWVSGQRDLGPRYLLEGTSASLSLQLRTYALGGILGLASLGAVQASYTLFGPMTILFLGISLVAIPEAARVLRRSPRHLPYFCMLVSGGLAGTGLLWGLVVLVAVPRGLGAWLLGPIWRETYPLVVPQTVYVVSQGIGYGSSIGLHALGASRRSLRAALIWAVLFLVFAVGGALLWGAEGTMWGAAITPIITAVYGWWQLGIAMRQHKPEDQPEH